MKVAQQVHSLSAPFGPQLSVELVRALLLVGRLVCHGVAGKVGGFGTFMSRWGRGILLFSFFIFIFSNLPQQVTRETAVQVFVDVPRAGFHRSRVGKNGN